jgi:hypothetical protein
VKRIVFILLIAILFASSVYAEEYSLEDLYKITLEWAEQVKISEEDLYIAEIGKDKATAALLPTVSASSPCEQFPCAGFMEFCPLRCSAFNYCTHIVFQRDA